MGRIFSPLDELLPEIALLAALYLHPRDILVLGRASRECRRRFRCGDNDIGFARRHLRCFLASQRTSRDQDICRADLLETDHDDTRSTSAADDLCRKYVERATEKLAGVNFQFLPLAYSLAVILELGFTKQVLEILEPRLKIRCDRMARMPKLRGPDPLSWLEGLVEAMFRHNMLFPKLEPASEMLLFEVAVVIDSVKVAASVAKHDVKILQSIAMLAAQHGALSVLHYILHHPVLIVDDHQQQLQRFMDNLLLQASSHGREFIVRYLLQFQLPEEIYRHAEASSERPLFDDSMSADNGDSSSGYPEALSLSFTAFCLLNQPASATLGTPFPLPSTNAKDSRGWTPLHLAAQSNHHEVVKVLLRAGADPFLVTEQGESEISLHLACKEGHEKVVEILLEDIFDGGMQDSAVDISHADMNLQKSFRAAPAEDSTKERYLEARTLYGQTPLILAAARGHTGVVTLLLSQGARIDARETDHRGEEFGLSALDRASFHGHHETVSFLLKHSAVDPNAAARPSLMAPLHWAADHPKVMRELLIGGARVNLRDRAGKTPLHFAADFESVEGIQVLVLEGGADLAAQDEDGLTPLWVALRRDPQGETAKALLELGAKASHDSHYTVLALSEAAGFNHETEY
ncbi:Ankyrin repeat and death domain-containing protein 1A [Phlyctochytrium bullatum]|nr:Ankyrin repeat and death domain-containing protein 1A [Phlyctochytrium bullatum]